MTRTYFNMKSGSASALSANAFFCCAQTAHNTIAMILGAIIMASIIICALAVRLSILRLSLLVLVLLAALLVLVEKENMPTVSLNA